MPQVTIYLSEELLHQVKREAKRRQLSVSAYMASLASRAARPAAWPADFLELLGSGCDIVEPDDPPPDPVTL